MLQPRTLGLTERDKRNWKLRIWRQKLGLHAAVWRFVECGEMFHDDFGQVSGPVEQSGYGELYSGRGKIGRWEKRHS